MFVFAPIALLLWMRGDELAAAAALICAGAWLGFGSLPRADRHNTARIATLTAVATLIATWATAMLLALVYAEYAAREMSARIWIPVMSIVATNIGGVIAVFRSTQTRTETSAALREVSDLRIAVLSVPVVEAADRASRAETVEDLLAGIKSMLQLAVNLTLLPRAVDQASLWALDEASGEWFICQATTLPRQQQFRQEVVERETPRAGIVANLAAGMAVPELPNTAREGDVYLVGAGLRSHPWFRVNPEQDRSAEGIAVVLLRRQGLPFGALCFTWEARVIPTSGPQAQEMIDILQRWAQAFSTALSRLYRLRELSNHE